MKHLHRIVFFLLVALLAAGGGVGCSEDGGGNNGNGTFVPDSGDGDDTGTPGDAGDTDGTDTGGADTGTNGDTGGDTDGGGGAGCGDQIEDLGQLSPGDSGTKNVRLWQRSGSALACADGTTRVGTYWFEFTVDEMAIIRLDMTSTVATAARLSLRTGGCESDAGELFCTDRTSRSAIVEPGQTYYLGIEGGDDSADAYVDLAYALETAACVPNELTCSAGQSTYCIQGTDTEQYACATNTCANDAQCAGDTCASAIEVDLPNPGATFTVDSHRIAYTNQWDVSGKANCIPNDEFPTGNTPYADVFFRVNNLQQGQTLHVENTSAGGSYVYFVLDSCTANQCAGAMFIDSNGDNALEWEAPASGSYLVVAEALSSSPREYSFAISRRQN